MWELGLYVEKTKQVNRCRWFVCVFPLSVYVSSFPSPLWIPIQLPPSLLPPPSSLRLPLPSLLPSCSSTPFSLVSAAAHMIKHGTQVITWRCQIKRPLIQMRSEVSKSGVGFAATTYIHTWRQRGDLRAGGRPAERQHQHAAFLHFLDKYHHHRSNAAKHAPVQNIYLYYTSYPCPLQARGSLQSGCSAAVTRRILVHFLTCVPLSLPRIQGRKFINVNLSRSKWSLCFL